MVASGRIWIFNQGQHHHHNEFRGSISRETDLRCRQVLHDSCAFSLPLRGPIRRSWTALG